jgi:hypothetical protein
MHAEYWHRCFESLRVGLTVREVNSICEYQATRLLLGWFRYQNMNGQFLMHGRGLGSDGPLVTGYADEATLDMVFTKGWAFIFKRTLSFEVDGKTDNGSLGDTMIMTEKGVKRLGIRPPGLVITGLAE